MNTTLAIPNWNDKIDLKWRLVLFKKYNSNDKNSETPLRVLNSNLNTERPDLSPLNVKKLIQHFALDEVDKAVLLGVRLLSSPKTLDDESQLILKNIVLHAYHFKDGTFKDELNINLKQFVTDSLNKYNSTLLPIIRSKLALFELLASAGCAPSLNYLISLNPNYLANLAVGEWVTQQRHISQFGTEAESIKIAKANLESLCKAIKGDSRRTKARYYNYWYADQSYMQYLNLIQKLRKAPKLDDSTFKATLRFFEIPDEHRHVILNKNIAAAEAALDILISKKIVKSAKAFREFQPKISALIKKHGSATIKDLLLSNFLDNPTAYPDLVSELNIWTSLDKLKI